MLNTDTISSSFGRPLGGPTEQASSIVVTDLGDTQVSIGLVKGNGRARIAIAEPYHVFKISRPTNGMTYSAGGGVYGSGTAIGLGRCVYKGTDDEFTITGLTALTAYRVTVYEYNYFSDGSEAFNASISGTVTFTTAATIVAPTTNATDLNMLGMQQLNWTKPGDASRTMIVASKSAISWTPTDNVSYTPNLIFGSGQEVTTGVFVMYVGTAARVDYLSNLGDDNDVYFRAFCFNISAGNNKYNTASPTGNPLIFHTAVPETWYMYEQRVIGPRQDEAYLDETSGIFSKAYGGGLSTLSDRWVAHAIADNNRSSNPTLHFDQSYRFTKLFTDPIYEQFDMDLNGSGTAEPNAALKTKDHPSATPDYWDEYQQWAGEMVVIADNNANLLYNANRGNISGRYSVGYATTTDGGKTFTRDDAAILHEASNKSYFSPAFRFYSSGLGKWILMVPNFLSASKGTRVLALEVHLSTDGATGKAFTKSCSNLFLNLPNIAEGGWGYCTVPILNGDTWYWYVEGDHTDSLLSDPIDHPGDDTYAWMCKNIYRVGCKDSEFANTQPNVFIDAKVFTNSQDTVNAVMPFGGPVSQGGLTHILVNTIRYKLESGNQPTIDVSIFSNGVIPKANVKVVGNKVFPGWVKKLYIPHQSVFDDTFGAVAVGKEIIDSESIENVGAPTHFCQNRIFTDASNYQRAASFTHDQDSFGISYVCDLKFYIGDTTCGIIEKLGTFKIRRIINPNVQFEVSVTGTNGNTKIYLSPKIETGVTHSQQYLYRYYRIGFTMIKNGGDYDLQLHCDNYINLPVTKTADPVIDSIAQTSNPITFGVVSGENAFNRAIGSCVIMDGPELTTEVWRLENLK